MLVSSRMLLHDISIYSQNVFIANVVKEVIDNGSRTVAAVMNHKKFTYRAVRIDMMTAT